MSAGAPSDPKYTEYRIILPYVTLEELEIALLYTLCTNSLAETGGGEGVEVVRQEPFEDERGKGHYYHKILHLASKVPRVVRTLAPKGSLEVHTKAWNQFPKIHTVYSGASTRPLTRPGKVEEANYVISASFRGGHGKNPDYMKDGFHVDMQTVFVDNDKATEDNVFGLDDKKLSKRTIISIDIVNDAIASTDYNSETDPTKLRLEKTSRGPLTADWKDTETKFLTVYMFVEIEFKWFGLQGTVQSRIAKANTRTYRNFYRTLIGNLDKCHGMTMDDIRGLEEKTKGDLDRRRATGVVSGTVAK